MTNLPENRELSELAPDDFFLFDSPEIKSPQVPQPPSPTPSPLLSRLGPLIRVATVTLSIIIVGTSLYWLAILPLQQQLEKSNERLVNVQSDLHQLEDNLRQVEARIPTPLPSPMPTPLPSAWSFNGQVHRINSQETLPGLTVGLVIWANREGAPRETLPTVQLSRDGHFTILKSLSLETGWTVQATINALPQPWQLQLSPEETTWQVGQQPNTFVATFERAEDVRPLVLTAVVHRIFSGEVSVWTNADTHTNLSDISMGLSISDDGSQWRPVSLPETYTTNADGQFEIVFDSNVESAWYRVEATLPTHYQVGKVAERLSDQPWIIGPGMTAQTDGPIPGGEFRDVRIRQRLLEVQLSVEEVITVPAFDSWQFSPAEQPQYSFYTINVTNTEAVSATWETLLPAGRYRLETWTPANVANATVRYTVQPQRGFSMGHPNCNTYQSIQSSRDGNWWNFETAGQSTLLVSIPEAVVLVTITAFPLNNGIMALSPVRFVLTDEEREFPGCASSFAAP